MSTLFNVHFVIMFEGRCIYIESFVEFKISFFFCSVLLQGMLHITSKLYV